MNEPRFLQSVEIPDGEYAGTWSAHALWFEHGGKEVFVQTELGVRGINIPVRFCVLDGRVDEKSIITQEPSRPME